MAWCQTDTLRIKNRYVNFGFSTPDTLRTPDVILIHSSYCPTGADTFDLECVINLYKRYDVSAHYIIDRNGFVFALVPENLVAHHGGKGTLPDGDNHVNTRSIGIELINSQVSKYTEKQYHALALLVTNLNTRYNIRFVTGHSNVAPVRKTDPWNFDWEYFNICLGKVNPAQIYIQRL